MSKPIAYPMVCGITGEPITEWKDVTFITTYIKGVKETFPIHINKWALMDLHNASPTSKKSREASASEADTVSEDVAVEEVAVSEDLETAPY
jgi:hypothetical protein